MNAKMLFIRCPKTKEPIPTGQSMKEETFKNNNFSGNVVQCPNCKTAHTWGKADAFFQE